MPTITPNTNPVNLLEPLDQRLPGQGQSTLVAPTNVGDYVSAIFPIFLYAAVALAIVYIAWGGLERMLSNTPWGKTEGSKKVAGALWGLVIALAAWIILQTINPQILTSHL